MKGMSGFRARNHPQQTSQRGESMFPDLGDPTDDVDDRGTPPDLFVALDKRFRFTLDVAASVENFKCPLYYTRKVNGLVQPWRGRVWCNPPYSDIAAWVRKAWREWELPVGAPELIVMLLPANRTEQPWWQTNVERQRREVTGFSVEFLPGRPRFVLPAYGETARPPFGCCLLIWTPVVLGDSTDE